MNYGISILFRAIPLAMALLLRIRGIHFMVTEMQAAVL